MLPRGTVSTLTSSRRMGYLQLVFSKALTWPILTAGRNCTFLTNKRDPWFWSYSCRHRPIGRTRLDFFVIWFSDRRDAVNISFDKINPSVVFLSSVQTCFGPSMLSGTWILCYRLFSYLDVPLIEILWQQGHIWVMFLCKHCKGTSWSVVVVVVYIPLFVGLHLFSRLLLTLFVSIMWQHDVFSRTSQFTHGTSFIIHLLCWTDTRKMIFISIISTYINVSMSGFWGTMYI